MNKIICFLLLLTIGWWSCNSAGKDPVATVKEFVRVLEKRDFAKAMEYTTDRAREELKKGVENDDGPEMTADDYTITLVEKDKEYATVALQQNKKNSDPIHMLLKKKGEKWLIYGWDND